MSTTDPLEGKLTNAKAVYKRACLYAPINIPAVSVSVGVSSATSLDVITRVTDLYAESLKALITRMIVVIGLYAERRETAEKDYKLNYADRPLSAVRDSVVELIQRFKSGLDQLQAYHKTPLFPPVQVEMCSPFWDDLEQDAKLLMEEISFLSKRSDEIQSLINAKIGHQRQFVALCVAIGGLFLTIIFTGIPRFHDWLVPPHLVQEQTAQDIEKQLQTFSGDTAKSWTAIQASISTLNDNLQTNKAGGKPPASPISEREIQKIVDDLDDIKMSVNVIQSREDNKKPIIVNNNNN